MSLGTAVIAGKMSADMKNVKISRLCAANEMLLFVSSDELLARRGPANTAAP